MPCLRAKIRFQRLVHANHSRQYDKISLKTLVGTSILVHSRSGGFIRVCRHCVLRDHPTFAVTVFHHPHSRCGPFYGLSLRYGIIWDAVLQQFLNGM